MIIRGGGDTSILRLIRWLLSLVWIFALVGCAGLIQNRPASKESNVSVDKMNQVLDDSLKSLAPAVHKNIPESVSDALMPAFNPGAGASSVGEEKFDLAVNKVSAKDFFQGLVKGTPYNMVVYPGVKGRVSLNLKQVTVPQVMAIVRDMYGYEYRFKNNLYQVLPEGLHTRIFQINYLDIKRTGESDTRVSSGEISKNNSASNNSGNSTSNNASSSSTGSGSRNVRSAMGTQIKTTSKSDFWGSLKKSLDMIVGQKKGRSVVVTPSSGVVLVRANSTELNAVEDYLRSTELIMARQVIIEAKILEVELNSNFQQGIDWNYLHINKTLSADGLPSRFFNTALSAATITNPVGLGGLFTTKLRAGDFNGVIQLLSDQGNVQVLSSPRIATVNNQKAVIKVGSDEYFVTNVSIGNSLAAASATTSQSTNISITPFFSGIALDVTPQIGSNGDIILHVHPSISKVTDQQKLITIDGKNVNLPLAFSKIRETDSIIKAHNGQIVVIGGLIQSSNKNTEVSVPILGDIPLLGDLFKQKRKESVRSELVILLRPVITDFKNQQRDIRRVQHRFGKMREELETPAKSDF